MDADSAGITQQEMTSDERVEEAALIERILAGESRHYSLLVERYQRRLYWGCMRLLGDADEAEDVVQEAFVKAYERLSDYDPTYRFHTWIYSIARNRCLNVLRKRKVWSLLSFQDPERAPTVAAVDATDHAVENQELAVALSECRAALSTEQRECFDLRHGEAFSYREIAVALGVPEGTVMSRLGRAREKMRICLESKGVVWSA